jgi:hypothetical protein
VVSSAVASGSHLHAFDRLGSLLLLAAACSAPQARPIDPGPSPPASTVTAPAPADAPDAAAPQARLDVAGGPEAAVADAATPPPPDPAAEACAEAIRAGMGDYSRHFASRTPVASARMLLRIFAKVCRPPFPGWAEAAERASRVGRAERSRILGRAVADTCPGAEAAAVGADVVAACPPPRFLAGADTVLRRLDAGTYAFVRALAGAGLRSVLLEELVLQASLTPELDR